MMKSSFKLGLILVTLTACSEVIEERASEDYEPIYNMPEEIDLATGGGQNFTGSGSAAQSNSLTGQVSVHVIRVLPGGNLEILGQKRLTLNNGDEYIRVQGIVRPEDISSDNVVQSDRIANADIKYIGAGELADTGKQGWLGRTLTAVNPF